MPENKIICGAMPQATKDFPDGYFNCCISSPPYWALRDYGTATWEGGKSDCDHQAAKKKSRYDYSMAKSKIQDGTRTGTDAPKWKDICPTCGAKKIDKQLGLEKIFEEYIDKLCTIYDEVKRVLRDDGCCFVNLGDTYAGSGRGWDGKQAYLKPSFRRDKEPAPRADFQVPGVSAKSLCLIPQRFAIEMVNRGWILRNVIIWHKPNPMPSSAKDRFTVDFEYIYFFTKQRKYWFEPQYEPQSPNCHSKGTKLHPPIEDAGIGHKDWHKYTAETWLPLGRNKRTVWTIPTQPFPEAHFATYPEKLVEPMIKAGCPEFVCTKCGKAREKIYETERIQTRPIPETTRQDDLGKCATDPGRHCSQHYFKGYTDCGCGKDWRPGIVLDCFCRKLHNWQGRRQAA